MAGISARVGSVIPPLVLARSVACQTWARGGNRLAGAHQRDLLHGLSPTVPCLSDRLEQGGSDLGPAESRPPSLAVDASNEFGATETRRPLKGFNPRLSYEASSSITRSYFLGHHHAAVQRMREKLSNIGLIIECRDMRVPLTSWNPTLETELEARSRFRIVVYTKRDLTAWPADRAVVDSLKRYHSADPFPAGHRIPACLFAGDSDYASTRTLLATIGRAARHQDSLLGMRAMVVGMPNSGKSTLLNRLRSSGVGGKGPDGVLRRKVARTGAEPGVTRSLGTPVRVLPADSDEGSRGVFVMDTPGVFVPYVGSAEAMLKLALVGCVRDGLVDWVTLADYLLFHMNLPARRRSEPRGHALYARFCPEPTNDVHVFLEAVARRSGKLGAGGVPNLDAAAEWVVQLWRRGLLGRFVLDDVTDESIRLARHESLNPPTSLNQARKNEKERRKERKS